MESDQKKLEKIITIYENLADAFAWIVVLGIVLEGSIASGILDGMGIIRSHWTTGSNLAVAFGVAREILFGKKARLRSDRLRAISNEKLGEAIKAASMAHERAAESDLARVSLEQKLAARTLNRSQFDVLQKLKGRIRTVIIASDADAEPAWFATVIATALQKAGIEVGMMTRAPHVHSTSNFICDKRAFNNPDGEPTKGEPLASVFNEAGIPVPGLLAGYPEDLSGHDEEIPMVVIGGRHVVPPDPPYLGEGVAPPPASMIERMRNP